MALLRCTILLYIPFVCASLLHLNGTIIHTLDANDSPPSNNTRTLWDIIWSCGVTLFACAWTAIHPNIQGMEEKTRYIVFRRIASWPWYWSLQNSLSPGLRGSFFSAIAIKKRFNDALSAQPVDAQDHRPDVEATLRSGSAEFRAWMGGFILYVNDEPRATLTPPDELLQFVLRESVDMPVIQKADIEDRSKGDILSKGVAILQLVWFVLQLAARRGQNLPITA
ncbi:hypothetical protein DEU56DRAFT_900791 [Suillus clintonianus]|uniref:uncharacterized protein n=1 Tax=Suillus clintonianus TaxID=1904413 RepID=UPI001B8870EC|nr:uncharacterized protein DEU56DRAFT_905625 [Suillus clintonianus]XP_041201053.1 uncharacterized protein DEU56DRAFT_905513 [Suillus clintonianus]XP_041201295.1 uncharacterized protein DEU56DRAFT_905420 [Suillus clintonianus]XP_041209763.1 uncharacterized protein DEU56DRAFT_900791 [Suillus clintonianus]KAG2109532.1 hypothetical protein DEU56DRAFT_905625 [Suillus clintonianus]KAG2111746.1 hypothetical protein DEU56DRAFT_905513 [Suillus clintonianus]KAG2113238.1 hypothetical protein DEU56DRAFT_